MVCWECNVGVKEVDQQYLSADASFFCFCSQGKFPPSAQSVSQCGPPTLGRIENTEQTLFLRMEKQGKVSKNMALYFSPSCKSAVWGSFPSSALSWWATDLGILVEIKAWAICLCHQSAVPKGVCVPDLKGRLPWVKNEWLGDLGYLLTSCPVTVGTNGPLLSSLGVSGIW